MLFIPMPLRKDGAIDVPLNVTRDMGGGRVVARHPVAASTSIEPDRRVEVPAPPLPEAAALISPVIVSGPVDATPEAEAVGPPGPKSIPPRVQALYRVSHGEAALRAGPSRDNRKIAMLGAGDTVDVLTNFDGKWLYVRLADGRTEGYVEQADLTPAD